MTKDTNLASDQKAMTPARLFKHSEAISGPKTALVVIDLQNAFMLPGMPVEVPAARDIVPNVNRLAQTVRAAGGKVIWVQVNLSGQRDSWSVFFASSPRKSAGPYLEPGTHGYALHDDLDVRDEDLIVPKTRYSVFIQGSSDLDATLRKLGIDTVVVVGTLTNVCCESSARDAMMLNYKVIMVSDANATTSDAEHRASLAAIARSFGEVVSTDELIARVTQSLHNKTAKVGVPHPA